MAIANSPHFCNRKSILLCVHAPNEYPEVQGGISSVQVKQCYMSLLWGALLIDEPRFYYYVPIVCIALWHRPTVHPYIYLSENTFFFRTATQEL